MVGYKRAGVIGATAGALLISGCAVPISGPDVGTGMVAPTSEPIARSMAPSSAPVAAGAPDASNASQVATVDLITSLSGRLSLRVKRASDGATDGGSLLFEFEGAEDRGTLVLNTPIGTTVARARWTPEGAEVVTAQGRRTAARLDDVAAMLLGQSLPMAALLRWIRAEPWSGAPSTAVPQGFEQLGWTVSLASWHEGVVTAHRAASPDRPRDHDILVRVRLDARPGDAPAGSGATGSR